MDINNIPLEISIFVFFLTACTLIIAQRGQVSVIALLIQYLTAGYVFIRLGTPYVAIAKIFVGVFICLLFSLSARQIDWRHRLKRLHVTPQEIIKQRTNLHTLIATRHTFLFMTAFLLGIAAVSLAESYPILSLPPQISIAFYWLILAGFLILSFSQEPLKAGQGLLTVITGFELWYLALENNLMMIGLWGIVNLLVALAIGYLTAMRHVVLGEEF